MLQYSTTPILLSLPHHHYSIPAYHSLHTKPITPTIFHFILPSYHHTTTSPRHHHTTTSPRHHTTPPPHHTTTPPPHHTTTPPPHHAATSPHHLVVFPAGQKGLFLTRFEPLQRVKEGRNERTKEGLKVNRRHIENCGRDVIAMEVM